MVGPPVGQFVRPAAFSLGARTVEAVSGDDDGGPFLNGTAKKGETR